MANRRLGPVLGDVCWFCKMPSDDESWMGLGILKTTRTPVFDGHYIHYHECCAVYSCGAEDTLPTGMADETVAKFYRHGEKAAGIGLKCRLCGKRGATTGCFYGPCQQFYHYTCARVRGYQGHLRFSLDGKRLACMEHAQLLPQPHEREFMGMWMEGLGSWNGTLMEQAHDSWHPALHANHAAFLQRWEPLLSMTPVGEVKSTKESKKGARQSVKAKGGRSKDDPDYRVKGNSSAKAKRVSHTQQKQRVSSSGGGGAAASAAAAATAALGAGAVATQQRRLHQQHNGPIMQPAMDGWLGAPGDAAAAAQQAQQYGQYAPPAYLPGLDGGDLGAFNPAQQQQSFPPGQHRQQHQQQQQYPPHAHQQQRYEQYEQYEQYEVRQYPKQHAYLSAAAAAAAAGAAGDGYGHGEGEYWTQRDQQQHQQRYVQQQYHQQQHFGQQGGGQPAGSFAGAASGASALAGLDHKLLLAAAGFNPVDERPGAPPHWQQDSYAAGAGGAYSYQQQQGRAPPQLQLQQAGPQQQGSSMLAPADYSAGTGPPDDPSPLASMLAAIVAAVAGVGKQPAAAAAPAESGVVAVGPSSSAAAAPAAAGAAGQPGAAGAPCFDAGNGGLAHALPPPQQQQQAVLTPRAQLQQRLQQLQQQTQSPQQQQQLQQTQSPQQQQPNGNGNNYGDLPQQVISMLEGGAATSGLKPQLLQQLAEALTAATQREQMAAAAAQTGRQQAAATAAVSSPAANPALQLPSSTWVAASSSRGGATPSPTAPPAAGSDPYPGLHQQQSGSLMSAADAVMPAPQQQAGLSSSPQAGSAGQAAVGVSAAAERPTAAAASDAGAMATAQQLQGQAAGFSSGAEGGVVGGALEMQLQQEQQELMDLLRTQFGPH